MAKSPQEVVFEGWLTKSPPMSRIWRGRWRRRWFLLTHSGNIPGQYILTYYTDRKLRKLKGVIHLDHCEQVVVGLRLDDKKLKFDFVFDIKTPTRTYYLAAETEEEMRSWANCICKICNLKPSGEDEDGIFTFKVMKKFPPAADQQKADCPDVEITEEISDNSRVTLNNFNDTPPITPVSKSPYIPISECITGKSPIFDPKDFKTLLEYNIKNSLLKSNDEESAHVVRMHHNNDSYELHQHYYLNCIEMQDPRFYDSPRKLLPSKKNNSPLHSPTDSDSVFNDEDWEQNTSSELNTSKNTRPSDSSAEGEIAAQKFIKTESADLNPPPRPPKPQRINAMPCYLNLTPTKSSKDLEESSIQEPQQNILTDDMYDFPRSHHLENDDTLGQHHCYNNAVPVSCGEGIIFRYDVSPRPGTSTAVFRYDIDQALKEPPPSPAHSYHSRTSSAPTYSNLPSPLMPPPITVPPPVVNRELKPKRKLSDTHSISSTEPPSPRMVPAGGAPSVDRKLKPPTPLQEAHMRKHFNTDEHEQQQTQQRKIRAAPSPTPPNLGRSHDSLLTQNDGEQVYHHLTGKMQYLDLDLEGSSSGFTVKPVKPPSAHPDTVYKKVDFMKTQAFNITRNILEKERQEPVTFAKK